MAGLWTRSVATQQRPACCQADVRGPNPRPFPNPSSGGGSFHGTTCFRSDHQAPSQLLALAIGAVYTHVGILGFVVTGFDNFASETDKTLLDFVINPLHNIVHLVSAVAGGGHCSVAGRSHRPPSGWCR
jgi:hypothetical protein